MIAQNHGVIFLRGVLCLRLSCRDRTLATPQDPSPAWARDLDPRARLPLPATSRVLPPRSPVQVLMPCPSSVEARLRLDSGSSWAPQTHSYM